MVRDQLRQRGIRDERVLAAMERVPRHEFVPPRYMSDAYGDHPIPIGHGQTISQPYIVAAMLQALELLPGDKVLEVGTGSGYQTALLAELVAQVYSIERHAALAEQARATLERLGYRNVHVLHGDGSHGLPEGAPFNAITVGAAAPRVPPPLEQQLAEGGRMIIPVGGAPGQELQFIRRCDGQLQVQPMEGCRFVPLVGEEGFRDDWC
jgi:protein-L-isoaspartate(D-aspartate) O-methyltransferase